MSERKANVRPELVGELFLLPNDAIPYRLVRCDTEPLALMQKVTDTGSDFETKAKPISELKDFQLLKPVVPRVRKQKPERKPRADKGGSHRHKAELPATGESSAG